MSSAVSNAAAKDSSEHDRDLDRMKQAAERYRKAMANEKDRERLIEDYLPLVKSIVSRMRHHFPDSYEMEDMYGIGAKALVVSVNQSFEGKVLRQLCRLENSRFPSGRTSADRFLTQSKPGQGQIAASYHCRDGSPGQTPARS